MLPRPCRKITVCVCGEDGGRVCGCWEEEEVEAGVMVGDGAGLGSLVERDG